MRRDAGGVQADLEAERKRRQWAEQLAETSLDVGEEHVSRADRAEDLLNDLIGRIESHREAAEKADAMRTGDLRLYRQAGRIRAELESLNGASPVALDEGFAERVSDHADGVPAPPPDQAPIL